MLKSLKEVINDPQIESSEYNDIYIKKIMVNKKEGRIDVHLKTAKMHDDLLLNKLRVFFKQKLNIDSDIFFHLDTNIINPQSFDKETFNRIIIEAFDDNPSIASLLLNSEFEFDDKSLNIIIENQFTYKLLLNKRVDHYLSNYIKRFYNLAININFKLKEINLEEYNSKKAQEEIELIVTFLNEKSIEKEEVSENYLKNTNNDLENKENSNIIMGKQINQDVVKIISINETSELVAISGEVFNIDSKETKTGKIILTIYVTDYTSSIAVKLFANNKKADEIKNKISNGMFIKVFGEVSNDPFLKELVIIAKSIEKLDVPKRMDNALEKRVELHLHTQMSAMDGVASAKSLIKRAKEWGHKAIAITDHGIVQAFPEAMDAASDTGVKVIYGVEGYLVNDGEPLILRPGKQELNTTFVVFDIETTGFNPIRDEIIEIGAVKVKDFKIIDRFSALINPQKIISNEIIKLTGITNEMLIDKPKIDVVLPKFLEFIGDAPVVAHNAKFDTGFIREKSKNLNLNFENTIIDTLTLSRWLLPDLKKHKLNVVAEHLGVTLENHHRAVDDAEATANIFIKFLNMLKEKGANTIEDINKLYISSFDYKKADSYHITILAKNYIGLKNLYKIISYSHLEFFHKRPRIPKSLLESMRDGLIIGSACESGEVFSSTFK